MCHVSTGKQVSVVNTLCSCGCRCPVALPIDDEIRRFEEHKKILQEQIERITKKITGLKAVNDS